VLDGFHDLVRLLEQVPGEGVVRLLGVLPTFTRETMGYDLIFATPDRSEAITVGYSFRGRIGLGILASPLNLLPGWDHPTPRPPERLGRRFAVEIAGRAEEIEALLADDD
jgi:hypothetical protein